MITASSFQKASRPVFRILLSTLILVGIILSNSQVAWTASTVLFSDNFNRADSATVGNGWTEVEITSAAAAIQSNRMCLVDTAGNTNRPLVRHTFQPVSSGQLTWTFDFDWKRLSYENDYRVFVQLGQGSGMSDNDLNAGAGINLVWTNLNGVQDTLAYRAGGATTGLQVVSGPATIQVVADLATHTYQVKVNGTVVGSNLPFDNNVSLDTLRYFSDMLTEQYFSGRCIDNLTIAADVSGGPTPTNTPTSAFTATRTPTQAQTLTSTPTSTATRTPAGTATTAPTFTSTPGSGPAPLFSDNFNRADSAVIGNGWTEVEGGSAAAAIQSNRMCLVNTTGNTNRPLVRHTFQPVSSGQLTWTFDFDWKRLSYENDYRVFVQLGQGSGMSDDNLNAGAGINLVWTNLNGVQDTLAYRAGGVTTGLQVVSGPATIQVVADLGTHTYQVKVNGTVVGSNLPFDNNVSLDTVRYFSDMLSEQYFSGRCIDNLTIETAAPGVSTPTATRTATSPAQTATSTPTSTPTATFAAQTATPTSTSNPTSTRTSTPTFTSTPNPTSTFTPTSTPTSNPTSTFTPTPTNSSVTPLPFADNFNRADSATVGNGWVEVEETGAAAAVQGNRLCLVDTSGKVNRPLVRHTFQPTGSGLLTWTFDFDWKRITTTENDYRAFIQLGQGSGMSDSNQDAGVGVNLVWTNMNGTQETLAYRAGGTTTGLKVVSGPVTIQVVADLGTYTYSVSVNGATVATGIPFNQNVPLDTVRYLADMLDEVNFSGRCLDNLSLAAGSPAPPTPTPVPTAIPPLACNGPVRIMPLGDSITKGSSSGVIPDAGPSYISYRRDLWNALISAGYNINFVGSQVWGDAYQAEGFDPDNEGHGGWRDDEIAFNLYNNGGANWLTNYPADIILLHIGTNALDTNPADVEAILNEVDQYEAANQVEVWVILARIINRSCSTNNPACAEAATTTTFNDNVQAMAQARIANGDKIILVDMENGAGIDYRLQSAGGDLWDNLHPYVSGYTKIAAVWRNGLNNLLPLCPVTPTILSTPTVNATVGQPYQYDVNAKGYPLPAYTLLAAPAGMAIDPNSGLINWTPGSAGSFPVTVQVANNQGSNIQSFSISVASPAPAAGLASPADPPS